MATLAQPSALLQPEKAGSALGKPDTRDCYRVRIPVTLHVPPVRLSHDIDGGVRATLVDISRVGAAVLTPLGTPLSRGRLIHCEIEADGMQLSADAEVRSAVTLRNHLRVGLRFVGLQPQQLARIEQFTARLERSALRHMNATPKPQLRT